MSGHSKWATIKRSKAVVDARRGAVYAKMAREIIVAAKSGADPAANFRLRQAVERAKAGGVPNDNIARAIEKGSGAGALDNFEELTYEGYGPGGVAMLVKCTTDNRNRTAGDVRSYFSKYGGNLGETGCVNWMFKERGEIYLDKTAKLDEDELMMTALEAGADDIDSSLDGQILITCQPEKLEAVQEGLSKAGHRAESADVVLNPLNTVEITSKDQAKQLLKLIDNLEALEDVQNVYTNFEMQQEWMDEFLN